MPVFGVEDFFAVGLGLDLAGAYLLARGLLTSLPDIATARTYVGMGAQRTVQAVSDRVDGSAGLLCLLSGFLLQACGYAASSAGLAAGEPSAARALTFAAVTFVVLAAALLVHRALSPGQVRSLAFRVTCLDGHGLPHEEPPGKALLELGVELGDPVRGDETYGAYARRVWGVDRVTDADDVGDEHRIRERQAGRKPVRRRG